LDHQLVADSTSINNTTLNCTQVVGINLRSFNNQYTLEKAAMDSHILAFFVTDSRRKLHQVRQHLTSLQ